MKRSLFFVTTVVFFAVGVIFTPKTVDAQRGRSSSKQGAISKIHHGVVVGLEQVDLKDNSKMKGALVGGTIAYATTSSSKSGKTKRRNTAAGMAVGGAVASSRPKETGMLYTVQITGGAVQVVTDQTEIHMGDCVVVEETSGGANIRRVSPEVCEPEAQELVEELGEEFKEEAAECLAAKQELADAKTDEAFDLALRKVNILCDG
jgi:hypothetical protein